MTSRIILRLLLILFFLSHTAFAAVLDMSRLGIGARSIAMGRAQSVARDVSSIFINPANASAIDRFGIISMYSSPQDDLFDTVLGLGYPIMDGTLGTVGVLSIASIVNGIQSTALDSNGRAYPVSTFDYASKLMMLSYGKEINSNLAAGGSLKLFSKDFDGISGGSANGFDLDLGIQFYPKDSLTFGLCAQDLLPQGWGDLKWGTGSKEDMPVNLKMGVNYSPRDDFLVLSDLDTIGGLHLGAEFWPRKMFAVRGGIESFTNSVNFSLGIGLKLDSLTFDYAYYLDPNVFSNSAHYFSLIYEMPYRTVEIRPFMPAQRPNPAIS